MRIDVFQGVLLEITQSTQEEWFLDRIHYRGDQVNPLTRSLAQGTHLPYEPDTLLYII